jgi:hypothetical protein
MQKEIHRHRSVGLLNRLPPTRLQLDGFAVSPYQLAIAGTEEKGHILLPFSQYACNVNLGIVGVVRVEE